MVIAPAPVYSAVAARNGLRCGLGIVFFLPALTHEVSGIPLAQEPGLAAGGIAHLCAGGAACCCATRRVWASTRAFQGCSRWRSGARGFLRMVCRLCTNGCGTARIHCGGAASAGFYGGGVFSIRPAAAPAAVCCLLKSGTPHSFLKSIVTCALPAIAGRRGVHCP